jgi:1-aminocyclopropane-1-carboxylate synthase
MVSNHTQWIIGEMFGDEEFIKKYISENRDQVTRSYKTVVGSLREMGVSYIPAGGSLFVWADFSKYLKEDSDKGQEELWIDIYRNSGVLLTPGVGFGHAKKGLFRIVHTAVPANHLQIAMARLKEYLK